MICLPVDTVTGGRKHRLAFLRYIVLLTNLAGFSVSRPWYVCFHYKPAIKAHPSLQKYTPDLVSYVVLHGSFHSLCSSVCSSCTWCFNAEARFQRRLL